jgi:Phytanoyl-CoA dioxygenase (PhyH)
LSLLLNLFKRRPSKPALASPVTATLHVSAVAETVETPGLVVIDIGARAEAAGVATVEVFAPGAETPCLTRRLELTDTWQAVWIAVHGHLLPDGPSQLRFALKDDAGRILAEQSLTVRIRNVGALAEETRASLKRRGTPLVVDVCDSGNYDYADPTLTPWHEGTPEAVAAHLAALAASGAATAEEIAALEQFVAKGFVVMPEVLTASELRDLNAAMDDAVARKVEGYEWGASQRIHNLHLQYPAIHDLWTHPKVLRMLSLIFDSPARPYQSLTYVFGSQQKPHQDTVALTPFPAGQMCGVWTALEDIQADSGELVIYPGSHRGPRVYTRDAGVEKVTDDYSAFGAAFNPRWAAIVADTPSEVYRPEAGTVLIWHENLMHGGSVRVDKARTRRSIVCHYFADGCIGYHDASGMPGSLVPPKAPERD